MHDIFLSYSRDDIEKAKKLSRGFEKIGFSVWWDRQIPSGRTFDDVIEEELAGSQCVIVLWSSNSVQSEWVRNEVQDGVDRKIMIPVLIEEVKIPLAFRRIQAANLIGWEGDTEHEAFQGLVRDVKSITKVNSSRKALEEPNEAHTVKEPPINVNKDSQSSKATEKKIKSPFHKIIYNKKLVIILSTIVLVIVALIAYISSIRSTEPIQTDKDLKEEVNDSNTTANSVSLSNKSYNTVQIAGMIWMAQNMDHEIPGSSWYYTDLNSEEMQTKYGRLYTWAAAKDACAVLGNGWHLPTDKEWSDFRDFIGVGPDSYQALTEGGSSGFSAVLGGMRDPNGGWGYQGVYGNYWSATAGNGFNGEDNAWVYSINKEVGLHRRSDNNQRYGFSCRCVKGQ